MLNVKRALNDMCDILIIDSSPVTAVVDPVILSHIVDGVVLVVESKFNEEANVMQTVTRRSRYRLDNGELLINSISQNLVMVIIIIQ